MNSETYLADSGMVFADRGYSILLHPPELHRDGHGYHHRVDLAAGPFQGAIDAASYASVEVLRRFRDELVLLYQSLKGEAHLGGYENLMLDLKGDGLGHITVRVSAIAGPCMDTRLSCTFTIDQTQLLPAITALAEFRLA
jgi:hypothetical protein